MPGIVGERRETVFQVELAGVFIEGVDFHGEDAGLIGEAGGAVQGVEQEELAESLAAGFLVHGQPADVGNGDRMSWQTIFG